MKRQDSAGVWVQWVLLSGLGWPLGFIGGWVGGYIGVSVGQWYTLRSFAPRSTRWLVLSVAGVMIGWLVSNFVVDTLTAGIGREFAIIATTFSGALVGLALGLAQWFYLKQFFEPAGWWIPLSSIGWAIGPFFDVRVIWHGSIAAAVTGLVLMWFLNRHKAAGMTVVEGDKNVPA